MKRKYFSAIFILISLGAGIGMSCSPEKKNDMPAVNIDDYKVNMPEVEGYNEFKSACITCHSLRYIEMQPDFPEKTWTTIVNKMVKNFGAVIPDSTSKKIVAYLVKVKGVE